MIGVDLLLSMAGSCCRCCCAALHIANEQIYLKSFWRACACNTAYSGTRVPIAAEIEQQ